MSNKAPNPQGGKINALENTKTKVSEGQTGFCLHQAWGIGIIRAFDAATNRFTVDFPEQAKKGHAMDALSSPERSKSSSLVPSLPKPIPMKARPR